MIALLLEHKWSVTTVAYMALLVFLIAIARAEDERYNQRWSGANARPSLCGKLGKGLRRLGRALGRFRPILKPKGGSL